MSQFESTSRFGGTSHKPIATTPDAHKNKQPSTSHTPDDQEASARRTRKKPVILEEDEYLDRMTNIIRRDFYPHLPSEMLLNQKLIQEYDSSARTKYTGRDSVTGQSRLYTPGTLDSVGLRQDRLHHEDGNLDQFLSTHNSEDNMLYEEIKQTERARHKAKHPWLYAKLPQRVEAIDQLKLPSFEEQASIESTSRINHPISWTNEDIRVKQDVNSDQHGFNRGSTINYSATRLRDDIFKEPAAPVSDSLYSQSAAALLAQKVGVDGRLMRPGDTPRVGGYSFVPMTPLQSDHLPTSSKDSRDKMKNSPSTPQYRVPSTPDRDQLAYDLADKISRSKRKMNVRYSPNIKQSPYSLRSTDARFSSLSPAARYLTSKLSMKREK